MKKNNLKNITIFYWLGLFLNGWFILPNWFFLYSQHLTIKEIGIVEGIAILTGILLEIPSGALADKIGKKKTIILGSIFILLSCVLLIEASALIDFIIGEVSMFVGFALHSGATEAFGYDSLVEQGMESSYDKVIGKHTSIAIGATILSTFFGGFLYGINPVAPFYAWGLFMIFSITALMFATEPVVIVNKQASNTYTTHIVEGVRSLFSQGIRVYLVPIITIVCMIKLSQGMVRQSMASYFSFNGETFGYLFALVTIPAVGFSFVFDRIKNYWGSKKLIILNLAGFLVGFIAAIVSKSPYMGAFVFLIFSILHTINVPLVSVIINQSIDSTHRATTLSTLALISQIPYIILVFLFPFMIEMDNILSLFWIYVVLIVIGLFYSIIRIKKNDITKTT